MIVVLYARVSSEKQAEKDLSISGQLKALRKYAKDRDWDICREFVDEAESARTANRPAFQEMIALAKRKQKQFDAILVWKLSRFARNREDSIIYKSLLRRHGVQVISINEQIDDTPSGKLLEGIIEVIDEFYSVNLAQDTIRGMKENAIRGFYNGGSIPYGYKGKEVKVGGNRKRKIIPDEGTALIVKRIFQMCIDGMGAKEIAKTLNSEGLRTNKGKTWQKNSIYYILKNSIYTGTFVWNRQDRSLGGHRKKASEELIRIENSHPALLNKNTFNRVQRLLEIRSPEITSPRTINSEYILGGIIRCGKCGATMQGCAAKSSSFHYYACRNYLSRGKDTCAAALVNKGKLESFIIERVRVNILTDDNLEKLARLTNKELARSSDQSREKLETVDRQLESLRERRNKLYDALETEKLSIDDVAPRIKELKSQMDKLEDTRRELSDQIEGKKIERLSIDDIKAYAGDLRNLLSKGSIIEQKTFLRSFIKRIDVNMPKVVVNYTLPIRPYETRNSEEEFYLLNSLVHLTGRLSNLIFAPADEEKYVLARASGFLVG